MYIVSIMQNEEEKMFKSISDLTVEPARFVKGVNKQGFNVVSTDPSP